MQSATVYNCEESLSNCNPNLMICIQDYAKFYMESNMHFYNVVQTRDRATQVQ